MTSGCEKDQCLLDQSGGCASGPCSVVQALQAEVAILRDQVAQLMAMRFEGGNIVVDSSSADSSKEELVETPEMRFKALLKELSESYIQIHESFVSGEAGPVLAEVYEMARFVLGRTNMPARQMSLVELQKELGLIAKYQADCSEVGGVDKLDFAKCKDRYLLFVLLFMNLVSTGIALYDDFELEGVKMKDEMIKYVNGFVEVLEQMSDDALSHKEQLEAKKFAAEKALQEYAAKSSLTSPEGQFSSSLGMFLLDGVKFFVVGFSSEESQWKVVGALNGNTMLVTAPKNIFSTERKKDAMLRSGVVAKFLGKHLANPGSPIYAPVPASREEAKYRSDKLNSFCRDCGFSKVLMQLWSDPLRREFLIKFFKERGFELEAEPQELDCDSSVEDSGSIIRYTYVAMWLHRGGAFMHHKQGESLKVSEKICTILEQLPDYIDEATLDGFPVVEVKGLGECYVLIPRLSRYFDAYSDGPIGRAKQHILAPVLLRKDFRS
jgi:hypothetical protein